jgi:hypothetical protein
VNGDVLALLLPEPDDEPDDPHATSPKLARTAAKAAMPVRCLIMILL